MKHNFYLNGFLVALLASLTLFSCGGGGQSISSLTNTTSQSSSVLSSQSVSSIPVLATLSFANKDIVYLAVGESYTNQLINTTGNSGVVYSSDNTGVASIDLNGKLNLLAPGQVNISAQVSGLTATYAVEVAPNSIDVAAWIGSRDTQLAISTSGVTGKLFRTTEIACHLQNYLFCKTGNLDDAAKLVTDTQWILGTDAYYSFIFGNREAKQFAVASNKLNYRWQYDVVFFKKKFFLIGGIDGQAPAPHGEIWTSYDGVNWMQVVAKPPFGTRLGEKLIVFNNKLWLFGGTDFDGNGSSDDVWSSPDGVNWTKEIANLSLKNRYGYEMIVWRGKVWLFGGQNYQDDYLFDVWSSTDGKQWTQEVKVSSFPNRRGFQLQILSNKLVMIGGVSDVRKNDVWVSSDGITWAQKASVPFWVGGDYSSFVMNNKLWIFSSPEYDKPMQFWNSESLDSWDSQETNIKNFTNFFVDDNNIRGLSGQMSNGTFISWISNDVVNWKRVYSSVSIEGREQMKLVTFNNAIWMFNQTENGIYRGDILSSKDGLTWNIQLDVVPFPITDIQVVAFNNKLWVLSSGVNGVGLGLWSSDDGINWASHQYDPNVRGQLIVHKNQLFILNYNGDISDWKSSDGDVWEQINIQNTWNPTGVGQIVSFQDRLFTIDGSVDNQSPQIISDLPTLNPGRTGYQLIEFNGRLWIVAGGNGVNGFDIWSTVDGQHWHQESANPEFGKRYDVNLVVLNDNLFLIGGNTFNYFYDVWKSSNGIEWRMGKNLSMRFNDTH